MYNLISIFGNNFCYWHFLITSTFERLYYPKWCPIFYGSVLYLFTKYRAPNRSNFLTLPSKLDNPYYHTTEKGMKEGRSWRGGGIISIYNKLACSSMGGPGDIHKLRQSTRNFPQYSFSWIILEMVTFLEWHIIKQLFFPTRF